VLWDFDGTLVDSRAKNLQVTQQIVGRVTGRSAATFPVLRSLDSYDDATRQTTNWRTLYREVMGLSEEETDCAGSLWSEYQLRDETPTPFYDGVRDALRVLGHLRQGIVSQNSRAHIGRMLAVAGLNELVQSVVGYEEVAQARQKPAPDGLLLCLEHLEIQAPATILFVGDHEADMECAHNASRALQNREIDMAFLGVAALWGAHTQVLEWRLEPAFRAYRVSEMPEIVRSLGG
jgi:HAD superfamily hydrolase (TIGR01549 family)